jgi:hypothetical protein
MYFGSGSCIKLLATAGRMELMFWFMHFATLGSILVYQTLFWFWLISSGFSVLSLHKHKSHIASPMLLRLHKHKTHIECTKTELQYTNTIVQYFIQMVHDNNFSIIHRNTTFIQFQFLTTEPTIHTYLKQPTQHLIAPQRIGHYPNNTPKDVLLHMQTNCIELILQAPLQCYAS